MKPALLILLGVMAIAPFAGATDWLSWQKVGDATLTWGPFTIYRSIPHNCVRRMGVIAG